MNFTILGPNESPLADSKSDAVDGNFGGNREVTANISKASDYKSRQGGAPNKKENPVDETSRDIDEMTEAESRKREFSRREETSNVQKSNEADFVKYSSFAEDTSYYYELQLDTNYLAAFTYRYDTLTVVSGGYYVTVSGVTTLSGLPGGKISYIDNTITSVLQVEDTPEGYYPYVVSGTLAHYGLPDRIPFMDEGSDVTRVPESSSFKTIRSKLKNHFGNGQYDNMPNRGTYEGELR
jgi:hypothetical protein